MKTIVLSVCNSLMAMSITRSLNQTGEFRIRSLHPNGREIAKECTAASADVLLMEAAYDTGATLDDCLNQAKLLRSFCPKCKMLLLCDENSAPEIARQVVQAKKDGLIEDFVYSSVSESYLTALLVAV